MNDAQRNEGPEKRPHQQPARGWGGYLSGKV
jgi:hypothetical protein